jgi:hypothetical protein
MNRKILPYAIGVALAALALCAETPSPAAQAVVRNVPKKTTAKKPGAKTTSSGTAKKQASRTTWRNRQLAPTPDRYKEIQNALVSKGYLKPEEAGGAWGDSSTAALKRFQADQNLESTGKINSLSLIALGLGPRRDPAPPPKPPIP